MKKCFALIFINLYTLAICVFSNPVFPNPVHSRIFGLFPVPGTPTLTIPDVTGIAAGPVSLRVTASGIVNMGSFQFSIEYDPSLMSYDTVTSWYPGISDVLIAEVTPGKLAFIWAASDQGIFISNGSFFTIRFTWNGSSATSPVNWSDDPTPKEFGDYDGILFFPEYNNGSVTGIQPVPVELNLNDIIIGNGQSACYNATQTINVAGNGTIFSVEPGGSVTLVSGQAIRLLAGTSVINGAYLNGYITTTGAYCDAKGAAIASMSPEKGETFTDILLSEKRFRVYPNPTSGKFVVELFSKHAFQPVLVKVYGPWGKYVMTKEITAGTSKELSLEGKPSGIYFVSLMQNETMETSKIILK